MKQLWLNEKRIDGIAKLIEEVEASKGDGEMLKAMVEDLLDAYDFGVLSRWLVQQQEYHRAVTDNAKKLRENLKGIVEHYDSGLRTYTTNKEIQFLYDKLAFLTGIAPDRFSLFEKERVKGYESAQKKLNSINKGKTSKDEVSLADSMSVKETEYIAYTSFQLDKILSKLRQDPQTDHNVLLLNTPDTGAGGFILDLRGIKNTTFIGEKDPKVYYCSDAEDYVVDLEKNNIRLKNFTIYFTYSKDCLEHLEECSENVIVVD